MRPSPDPPAGQRAAPSRSEPRARVEDVSFVFIRLLFDCIQFKVEK